MTGYTVHTGSNQKFSQGWDQIFRGKTTKAKSQPAAAKPTQVKKAVKKSPSPKSKTR